MHDGFVARGLERVEAAFAQVIDRQPGTEAALAVCETVASWLTCRAAGRMRRGSVLGLGTALSSRIR